MNNQARSCKLKCKYNVQDICSIYGECVAKDLFISELEKIRQEMHDIEEPDYDFSGFYYCLDAALTIVEHHISELKGESNVLQHRG